MISKKGKNGKTFSKSVAASEWKVPAGYEVKVELRSEREAHEDLEFKKIQFVKQSFINNPTALKIAKRKELELIGWTPEEVDEVMQLEEQQGAPANGLPSPQVEGDDTVLPPENEVSLEEVQQIA